jgi:hypothetical protein
MLLATAGAIGGLALAHWLTRAFVAIAPAGLPRLETVAVDARVAAFALGLGALTLLVFGIAPALSLARTPTTVALAEGGRDATSRRHLGQRVVVAAEIALALVLLVGASLLGETLFRLTSQPLGFNPSGLAVVSFRMTRLPGVPAKPITAAEYQVLTPAQFAERRRFFDSLRTTGWWLHLSAAIERVAALPGVVTVGGYTAPFIGARVTAMLRPFGRQPEEAVQVRQQLVTERYFEAMGVPILRGRNFGPGDRRGAAANAAREPVGSQAPIPAVVSRALERRFFGGDAVGKMLIQGSPESSRVLDIIGVVADTRWRKTADDDLATCYLLGGRYHSVNTLVVRSARDVAALLPAVRSTLRDYDPNIVVTSTATMDSILKRSIAEEHFRATLSAIYGGAALVLAAVGLYGLAARRVADRRREIGIRIALGARPSDVLGLVLRDALCTVGLGLAAGVPAALVASQATRTLLFGVTPTAPRVFVVAAIVLALAALVATLLPARRAAAIDPMIVLKV